MNTYEISAAAIHRGLHQRHASEFCRKAPVSAGAIALQLEGFPIDFRNVWLEPLAKK